MSTYTKQVSLESALPSLIDSRKTRMTGMLRYYDGIRQQRTRRMSTDRTLLYHSQPVRI